MTEIKNEFIKQCEWLAIHEPGFAPRLEIGQTFGDWFDNTIDKEYDSIMKTARIICDCYEYDEKDIKILKPEEYAKKHKKI